jgi:hypothetical protein
MNAEEGVSIIVTPVQVCDTTLIEKAAFTGTTNLAWILIAILSLVSMATLPFILGGKALKQQPAVQRAKGLGKSADGVE